MSATPVKERTLADLSHVRFGSLASDAPSLPRRPMSVVAPIASLALRCSETPLCARSELMHRNMIVKGSIGSPRIPCLI